MSGGTPARSVTVGGSQVTLHAIIVAAVIAVIAKLDAVKQFGFEIRVEDLGSGYSSLNYPKRSPVDRLKVDPLFVRDSARWVMAAGVFD